MHVQTETLPTLRLAAIRHVGPYHQIGRAFGQLEAIVAAAGLPHREMVAVFHDDPRTIPADTLRSDAGVIVDEDVALPAGLVEQRTPAGRYATAEHAGSYERLPDAWREFTRAVAESTGQATIRGFTFELYRNTPMEVPQDQLRTVLHLQIADTARYATP